MESSFLRGQRGVGLIETLVALGIMAAMAVVFLSALNTTSRSTALIDQQATAASLVQSQVEHIKALAYDATGVSYKQVQVTLPPEYTMVISDPGTVGDPPRPDEQQVTVSIRRGGKTILEMKTIKINS